MRQFLIALISIVPWLAQAQLESTSDLNRGLVGWWRFNEGTGTNAFDLSGNGNTGTLSGSTLPVWTNGVFGGALYVTTTHSYVLVNSSSSLDITNDITVSCWVKGGSQSGAKGIVTKDGGSVQGWMLFWVSGKCQFDARAASSYNSSGASTNGIDTGTYHMVTGERTGSMLSIWIDGVLSKQTDSGHTQSIAADGTSIHIGDYNSGTTDQLTGSIDDVRIYSRALSATEVLNLYCQGGGR